MAWADWERWQDITASTLPVPGELLYISMPSIDRAGNVIRPAAPPSHASSASESSPRLSADTNGVEQDFPPGWVTDHHSPRRCAYLDSRRGAVLHNGDVQHFVEVAYLPIYSFSGGSPVLDAVAPSPFHRYTTAERLVQLCVPPPSAPLIAPTVPTGNFYLRTEAFFSRPETPAVPEAARGVPEWILLRIVIARYALDTAQFRRYSPRVTLPGPVLDTLIGLANRQGSYHQPVNDMVTRIWRRAAGGGISVSGDGRVGEAGDTDRGTSDSPWLTPASKSGSGAPSAIYESQWASERDERMFDAEAEAALSEERRRLGNRGLDYYHDMELWVPDAVVAGSDEGNFDEEGVGVSGLQSGDLVRDWLSGVQAGPLPFNSRRGPRSSKPLWKG